MPAATDMLLSPQDAYALARALVGLPRTAVPISPLAHAMLTRIDVNQPDGMKLLKHLLTPDLMKQVLSIDPQGSPPSADSQAKAPVVLDPVPELPPDAVLKPEHEQAAAQVGRWLRDYLSWAGSSANETPCCSTRARHSTWPRLPSGDGCSSIHRGVSRFSQTCT